MAKPPITLPRYGIMLAVQGSKSTAWAVVATFDSRKEAMTAWIPFAALPDYRLVYFNLMDGE
jgi:hypothetical protein